MSDYYTIRLPKIIIKLLGRLRIISKVRVYLSPIYQDCDPWHKALSMIMSYLPDPKEPHWTKKDRSKWLAAMEAVLYMLIDVDEQESDK